jgi:putative endonuclease
VRFYSGSRLPASGSASQQFRFESQYLGYAVFAAWRYRSPVLRTDPSTWTDPRHRAGVEAERLVAEVLKAQGYQVLEHRYRYHRHDVDLVARRGSVVAFVEVKTRSGFSHGSPLEAVTRRKRLDLARAAAAWLQRHGRPGDAARFDVVAVDGDRVEWLQSAFRPGWR